MATIRFGASAPGAGTVAMAAPTGQNRATFRFGATVLKNLLGNDSIGNNYNNIAFNIQFVAAGTKTLVTRTVKLNAQLNLNATGNGQVINHNFNTAFQFNYNGSFYRCNYFKDSASIGQYYKFSNSSAQNAGIDLRYIPGASDTVNPATTQWVPYTGDGGNGVPANGAITISAVEAAGADGLNLNAGWNGTILFRVRSGPTNITAMGNAVRDGNATFNIPMYYRDGTDTGDRWVY